MIQKPMTGEYPSYYEPYIKLVPDGHILQILRENLDQAITFFQHIPEAEENHRYAPGKWSIKEVLGHITDTERIMSYRLLRIGRGDDTPLAGFDESTYVQNSKSQFLSMENLLHDFSASRNATLSLIEHMPEEMWSNKGIANNLSITTNAIAYIIAGHEIHHRKIVTERYLTN